MDGPIDVVYTYVNGENPCFQKKYAAATGTDVNDIRCIDHGELAFSVNLTLRHLPWVRTVHIVYGGNELKQETMQALEAISDYKKLNLVPQEDILPVAYYGTFCSCTVEAYLHRIEGLSDWFFYFNDDMCIGRPMTRADFFDAEKQRFFIDLSRRQYDIDFNQAQRHNTNALRLFHSRFLGVTEKRLAVAHQASLMHRVSCARTLTLFEAELTACHQAPLRTDNTLNFQLLASLVAIQEKQATIRVGRRRYGLLCVMAECQPPLLDFILTHSPQLFCINSVNKEYEARYHAFTRAYLQQCNRHQYRPFTTQLVPNLQYKTQRRTAASTRPSTGQKQQQQQQQHHPRFWRVYDLPTVPEPTQWESALLVARYTRAHLHSRGQDERAQVLSVPGYSHRVCVPDPPGHRSTSVQSLRRARRQRHRQINNTSSRHKNNNSSSRHNNNNTSSRHNNNNNTSSTGRH